MSKEEVEAVEKTPGIGHNAGPPLELVIGNFRFRDLVSLGFCKDRADLSRKTAMGFPLPYKFGDQKQSRAEWDRVEVLLWDRERKAKIRERREAKMNQPQR